ncbi:SDR family NAD(P)-dependent oxidoreductase [Nocardia sp. NPDC050710]|uniref:SDR family NAD(P)-dependent oxidoreductase n=1 Tax=Nocardia sp. NPDC050710 TaxID=3157220 RepID=UPI0033F118AD
MKIQGSRILLTGATGGLGQAIARDLHRRGGYLISTGRNGRVLGQLATELAGEAIEADLAERDSVSEVVAAAGRVDILIANAGLPGSGRLADLSPRGIDRAIDVNLRSHMVLSHALIGQMRERHSGHLVFVSSLSGKTAAPGSSVYNATKFAMRGFALSLREELRGDGIGVSVIFPGFVRDAGMFADSGNIRLPRLVGTVGPDDVSGAVAQAIERNRGEIDVAPLMLRLGARFSLAAPALSATVQRWFGAERLVAELAAGQTSKR